MSLTTTQGYRYRLVGGTLPNTVILDTFANEDIKVSNNITQLFDIGAVPGTFTRTITLPGTKKNNKFFEQYYDISVYNPDIFNTNQKVAAYLDFGGVFLVNGYLQLLKVNVFENKFVDSYEVNLFGSISNFSVDSTRFFLGDLSNLGTYNHTSSLSNITASWQGDLFNGDIVYPMADYGQRIQFSTQTNVGIDDPADAMVVQDYKPAMRLKVIWDAIFEKLGYTYTSTFMNEPFIDDIYVFLNTNKRYPIYNQYNLETYGLGKVSNPSGSTLPTGLSVGVESDLTYTNIDFDYNNFFTIGSPTEYNLPIASRVETNQTLCFRVSGSGAGSGVPQFSLSYYSASVFLNSASLTSINSYLDQIRQTRTQTGNELYVLTERVNTPNLPAGKFKTKISYTVLGTNNFNVTINPAGAKELSAFEVTQIRQAGDQEILNIPLNMPYGTKGIRLIDFIRAVQKKFNLVIYEDKTKNNNFIVETFNDWYKDGVIQDFNKYINLDQKIEFLPANNLAFNVVSFTDIQDSDYVSKTFQQVNNRTFGQAFYQDTGSYFSQGEFKVDTVFGSGPIFQVPQTGYSGSTATGLKCNTYRVYNYDFNNSLIVEWIDCLSGVSSQQTLDSFGDLVEVCARQEPTVGGSSLYYLIANIGDCSPFPDQQPSGSTLPMSIPLFIGDQNYAPTRVQPRMMFFNGMLSSSLYYIEAKPVSSSSIDCYAYAFTASADGLLTWRDCDGITTDTFLTAGSTYTIPCIGAISGSVTGTGTLTQLSLCSSRPDTSAPSTSSAFTIYPYFDNYNVITGSFPTSGSKSLLFNNEQSSNLGTIPQNSLLNDYWDTYINLLYNPRTRLVNAAAVIPLADYFEIELNDLVQFRGNYYHLRAINDYNLTTGECLVQLLGPVISDAVSSQLSVNLTGSFNCDFDNDFDNPPCTQPSGSASPTPTPSVTPSITPTVTPTPSTTPFSCAQCKNWEYNTVPVGGDIIRYYDCNTNASSSIAVSQGDTGSFCNCNTTGNPSTDNGTQLTEIGTCVSPTPTPSPTATPSVTPSLTPSISMTPSVTPSLTPTPSITPSASGPAECLCYRILNETGGSLNYTYYNCETGEITNPLGGGQNVQVCSSQTPFGDPGITVTACTTVTDCNTNTDCTGCN